MNWIKNPSLNKFSQKLFLGTSVLALGLMLGACASNKDKARKIETKMDKSQDLQGENLGIKDGKVVVQRKVMLAEELRKLQSDTYDKEYTLYGNPQGSKGLLDQLKECNRKLADPRIGGTGKLKDIEKPDILTKSENEIKFGVDENEQLVSITEEGLSSRISRFKNYNQVYAERLGVLQGKIEVCENDYRVALINNGLNPEDTKSKGEWVSKGGTRVWQAREKTSDDPEELARRKAKKDRKAEEEN